MSPHKPPNITRLYFVNVNGLRYGPQGGDFADICSTMASSHIDLLGLVETKLDTRLSYVVDTCSRAARAVFPFSRVVLSSSAISYNKPFKPGGTALISVGSITGRITHTHHDHMGRWSSTSFTGANSCKLTVISAYQVCKAPSRNDHTHFSPNAKLLASAAQQQAMINMLDPSSSMHPRAKFRVDLLAFIQKLQKDEHDIVLVGDFTKHWDLIPLDCRTLRQNAPCLTSWITVLVQLHLELTPLAVIASTTYSCLPSQPEQCQSADTNPQAIDFKGTIEAFLLILPRTNYLEMSRQVWHHQRPDTFPLRILQIVQGSSQPSFNTYRITTGSSGCSFWTLVIQTVLQIQHLLRLWTMIGFERPNLLKTNALSVQHFLTPQSLPNPDNVDVRYNFSSRLINGNNH